MLIQQHRHRAAESPLAVPTNLVAHVVICKVVVDTEVDAIPAHPRTHTISDEGNGGMHE